MFLQLRQTVANLICPEFRAERRALERAANVCALTGAANRRAFDLAEPAATACAETVFVLFDANNFGRVNKVCGHKVGDYTLTQIARAISSAAFDYDCGERFFRLGGDEFVVICPANVAEDIRNRAEFNFGDVLCGNVPVSLSGTIGANLDAADAALQQRKAERKAGK